jgi:ribosomal-protein-alanine N-acetyltransferase
VRELLNQKSTGRACPCVIEEVNEIVGRVNFTRLPGTRIARLGYRVAQQHRGKGVASFGVANILKRRHDLEGLDLISAFVSVENFASQAVLAKNGFTGIGEHPVLSRVGNRRLTCIEYNLVVSPVI